ncbi:MAG: hypothetical protein JXA11_06130 [Phycisphaerae bacterium]|nr:hypothetical protein [Phycisphaerae bacterium]
MEQLRQDILNFIDAHRVSDDEPWLYRYSVDTSRPTLYSSAYAAMTRSLLHDLDGLSSAQRDGWVEYFHAHQDDDGLFRDPVIFDQGWYKDDPLWCGRAHLTCHVLPALTCLDATAKKPFAWLGRFYDIEAWLPKRNFIDWAGCSDNEIMNVGTILQYSRDVHGDARAAESVEALLDWLANHHLDPDTGLWGSLGVAEARNRSISVMAAYHLWPLFFHDDKPIPHMRRAMDTVLTTQNELGGFGWGVHNPAQPNHSSACEDIDSIDPLVRMSRRTDYRRDDVLRALRGACAWVKQNQTPDGGFVFMLDQSFEYGHPELASGKNIGAMFPTWFRTLSLALLGKALHFGNWNFIHCPGYQFWRDV